jgi:hypothetical protein
LQHTTLRLELCPDCLVGSQARAQFLNDDLGFNLAAILLPFLVIGAICLRVEARGRVPRRELP